MYTHFQTEQTFPHALNEILDDLEVDVGFQQREAHLAQALLNIGLVKARAPAEFTEDAAESVGKAVEHSVLP